MANDVSPALSGIWVPPRMQCMSTLTSEQTNSAPVHTPHAELQVGPFAKFPCQTQSLDTTFMGTFQKQRAQGRSKVVDDEGSTRRPSSLQGRAVLPLSVDMVHQSST